MSMYDILSEITERQITKTEMGDSRIYGVVRGIVAKNYDQDMPGRVCITIPTRDDAANELQWARLAMPSSGPTYGHYFLPEVGDQVLVIFEGGQIEKPYIIGCVPKDNSTFVSKVVDEKNRYKKIATRRGTAITFDDSPDSEDGSKDKLILTTANDMLQVMLDNENQTILLTDKKKANKIELITTEGSESCEIKVRGMLTINVGDNITVSMNGESGAVSISSGDFTVNASNSASIKTDSSIKFESGQITENASASHKISSSGMVSIGGSPIKIG
ncbi:MAG: phage baseplate assembly protein V [Oscillospiraceae bacterium]